MNKYDPATIESRWQARWEQDRTFKAPNPGDPGFDPDKPKFYVLDMFPYPSGVGLHVGHPLGYIATDIVARYKRMRGFNVLHPMGYDAFGLPAEQFAVEHGVHPRVTTEQNIANMTRQLKRLGLSYDWDRCFATTDPGYYKWTQWIFLQLYGAWFDPASDHARPIHELIADLDNDNLYIGPDGELVSPYAEGFEGIGGVPAGCRRYCEMTRREQRELIDSYRLAYIDEVAVNWCPALGTVLANEEVTNEGRSERGNYPVYQRPLRQWMLRITAYAERLLRDLDLVKWPESIKLLQRNWIGRSEGTEVQFSMDHSPHAIEVFTTRPDTLFGATYMVLAPEHRLVDRITTPQQREAVDAYKKQAAGRTEVDRTADARKKTGVFTGAYAINPVNGWKIPVWIADYVLTGYGTGAIMAVPAHDQRDFEFATTFDLPIVAVVEPPEEWFEQRASAVEALQGLDLDSLRKRYAENPAVFGQAWEGEGYGMNSANADTSLDALPTERAKRRITQWLEEQGLGRGQVQYKLRDWLFSRQRYWGEPFPILHGEDGEVRPVPEDQLPVELPDMEDFRPEASDDPDTPPRPPLSRAPQSWRIVELDGKRYTRELNTMPQWAGSCWYYLRFTDPNNEQRFAGRQAERYWMLSHRADGTEHRGGVDLYVGGVEHAVLHLLYARFWHKVLYDLGHVATPEPFGRLFNQGYIQAYYYEDDRGVRVPAEEVVDAQGRPAMEVQDEDVEFFHEGRPVRRLYGKMGKSLKNAITPDHICDQYGCDTLRLYEMYMGPLDQSKLWNVRDIIGVHRFLQRLWRNFVNEQTGELRVVDSEPPEALRRLLHHTIQRVTTAMNTMAFNVAIAALIELNNALVNRETLEREIAEPMVLLLSPMAPHVAEELWQRLGHEPSLACAPWPEYDPAMLEQESVELPVQINGKVRGRIRVPADADDKAIEQAAMNDEKVAASLNGREVKKCIVIRKRMVNLVVPEDG